MEFIEEARKRIAEEERTKKIQQENEKRIQMEQEAASAAAVQEQMILLESEKLRIELEARQLVIEREAQRLAAEKEAAIASEMERLRNRTPLEKLQDDFEELKRQMEVQLSSIQSIIKTSVQIQVNEFKALTIRQARTVTIVASPFTLPCHTDLSNRIAGIDRDYLKGENWGPCEILATLLAYNHSDGKDVILNIEYSLIPQNSYKITEPLLKLNIKIYNYNTILVPVGQKIIVSSAKWYNSRNQIVNDVTEHLKALGIENQ